MREYGKIHRSFWTNKDLRQAGESARTLAAYLLTGPHTTMLGCFRIPDAYVAEDLGWDVEGVRLAFGALEDINFAVRDAATDWVLIPRFLKWNKPENPNQVKGVLKAFAAVPDFALIDLLLAAVEEFVGARPTPPKRSGNRSTTVSKPSTAPVQPFRNHDSDSGNGIETKEQKQDQDQDQEQKQAPAEPAPPPHPSDGSVEGSTWLPPEQTQILAELRRHRILEPIATARFADTLAGRSMTSGRPVAWGLVAIADAAADASEEGLNAGGLAKKVRSYWDNAKRPREADDSANDSRTATAGPSAPPAGLPQAKWAEGLTEPKRREATPQELREAAIIAHRSGFVPPPLEPYLPVELHEVAS